jgi:hypothetical protein
MVRSMIALRRLLLLLVAAGLAGLWLRRRLEAPAPVLAPTPPTRSISPVTDEMNAIPLPLEEELAMVDGAEPEVDIVDVVDDLIEDRS